MPLFSLTTIQLQHGDIIYLTSDGFLDQFGGKHGKRFMTSNFTKMLSKINTLPMSEQYNKVIETHEKWRGEKFQQIDDIIVFGLKIL
jgi:serine phosphatase RsbU (regulator of sigma subunit)